MVPDKTYPYMRLILIISLLFIQGQLRAQYFSIPLGRELNLYAIDRLAQEHFSTSGKGTGTGFKQYMRWKNEMEYRIDRSGQILNFDAQREDALEKMTEVSAGRATHAEWSDIGPHNIIIPNPPTGGHGLGRINCMAFHPTNNNIFWVGTAAGGLWKTEDSGNSWTPYLDGMEPISVSDIAIHPNHPDTMYILTGDGDAGHTYSSGIRMSSDGGLSWQTIGSQFNQTSSIRGYRLVMDPQNPDTMIVCYKGYDYGILYTTNGGLTWSIVGALQNKQAYDAEFSPNSNRIFVTTAQECYYSDNVFMSTHILSDPDFPSGVSRKSIAISPSQPSHVYLLFGGVPDTGIYNGLFKSVDNGLNFTKMSDSPNIFGRASDGLDNVDQTLYDISLLIDPANDTKVFVGGINQWKSTNSGVTWTRSTSQERGGGPSNPFVHADWHNNYFNNGKQYACVDGGLYVLEVNATEWIDLTPGMAIGQFYNIDVRHGRAMGGMQDNGTLEMTFPSSDGNAIDHSDGFGCVYHPENPNLQFVSRQSTLQKLENGNYVNLWNEMDGFWFTKYWMPTDGNYDYIFFTKEKTLYNGDYTVDPVNYIWRDLNTAASLPNGQKVRNFAQGVTNPDIAYLVNSHHLIKTINLSQTVPTWAQVSTPVTTALYTDIIVSPENINRIWLTCGSYEEDEKVFFSPDGGITWTNITYNLPNVPIRCIVLDTNTTNESIYIGTEVGIFYRNNTLADWVNYATYFPRIIVNELVIYNNQLYAGTFGRGIWKSALFSCPSALNLTPGNDPIDPENIGYQEFRASSNIMSTRVIQGSFSDVRYAAGNYIDLKLGFWSKSGSQWNATIDGCPD